VISNRDCITLKDRNRGRINWKGTEKTIVAEYFNEGNDDNHENSLSRWLGFAAKIETEHFPKTRQKSSIWLIGLYIHFSLFLKEPIQTFCSTVLDLSEIFKLVYKFYHTVI
jgi:hypothetical protein